MDVYILRVITLIGIYVILTIGANVSIGYTGIVSLAHAAVFGVGAYATALSLVDAHMPFLAALAIGIATATAISLVVGALSLRLQDDYFVIGTLGLQMIVFAVLNNWQEVTRGPFGIPGIPVAEILGWKLDTPFEFVLLTGACAASIWGLCRRIVRMPLGRVLCAIREDEKFTQSLGKDPAGFKLLACGVSGVTAGLAGGLFAVFMTFIDPTSFTLAEGVFILSIVIIGGAGSLWGPVLGSVVLVTVPEVLRFVGLPGPMAGNLRQILYGAVLVAILMIRPQGLVGKYSFDKR